MGSFGHNFIARGDLELLYIRLEVRNRLPIWTTKLDTSVNRPLSCRGVKSTTYSKKRILKYHSQLLRRIMRVRTCENDKTLQIRGKF